MVKALLLLLACLSLGPPPLPEPGTEAAPHPATAARRPETPESLSGFCLHLEEATGQWELRPLRGEAVPEAVTGVSVPREALDRLIFISARRFGVDERLVRAVLKYESGGNPLAVSPKGAQGLMQLMPATAHLMGVRDAFDPADNLAGGVKYLKLCLERFQGDLALAVAAYNAGPEAVARYGGLPPYQETRDYVERVLTAYHGTAPIVVRLRPVRAAPAPEPASAPSPPVQAQGGLHWRLPTPTWKIPTPQAKVGPPRWKAGL